MVYHQRVLGNDVSMMPGTSKIVLYYKFYKVH